MSDSLKEQSCIESDQGLDFTAFYIWLLLFHYNDDCMICSHAKWRDFLAPWILMFDRSLGLEFKPAGQV